MTDISKKDVEKMAKAFQRVYDRKCNKYAINKRYAQPDPRFAKIGSTLLNQAAEIERLTTRVAQLEEALDAAGLKLLAYVGVCKGDKELTEITLPTISAILKGGDV